MRADQATPGTITKSETVVVTIYGRSPDGTITYLTTRDGTRNFLEIWPSDHDVTEPGPGLINRYDTADFPPATEFDPAGCVSCLSSVRHTHSPGRTIDDLEEGDTLTVDSPPACCGTPMTSSTGPADTVWDCQFGDSQIYTDTAGVITEPPAIRCG